MLNVCPCYIYQVLEIHRTSISYVTDATETVRQKITQKSVKSHSLAKLAQMVRDHKRWDTKKATIMNRIELDRSKRMALMGGTSADKNSAIAPWRPVC